MQKIELSNNTVARLNLDYVPDYWPAPGTYQYLGSHIQKPWEGGANYNGYEEQLQRFNNIKEILKPHEEMWVDCRCIAALVPSVGEEVFDVVINGLHVCTAELKLRGLRKLNSIRTPVTLCNAKIEGGGYLRDGRQRSYNIMCDLPEGTKDIISLQRSREKSQFKNKYGLRIIQDHYKRKFFASFNNRCFKCGSTNRLDIDHHIPIVLGGHLVPGNLVALCKPCNNRKLDRHPSKFYTQDELKALEILLKKQREVLQFNFDYEYWRRDRKGYLISLGIEPHIVDAVLNNSNHPFYIEPIIPQKETSSLVISIDISDLLEIMIKDKSTSSNDDGRK